MSRPHKINHESETPGHDRPWVYFMIDSFFLVTQFFVLTFHVRNEEVVLPQKLPGDGPGPEDPLRTHTQLTVHVSRPSPNSAPTYLIRSAADGQPRNASEFIQTLAETVLTRSPQDFSVRVSYDPQVPFGDVMPVFNACAKFKIPECGLVPLR